MNPEQTLVETFRLLSPKQQKEVLNFTQSMTENQQNRLATMTPHQQAEDWLEFMENQPKNTPGLPDEALSRDTIYD